MLFRHEIPSLRPEVPLWHSGRPLTAVNLNQALKVLNGMRAGVRPGRQRALTGRPMEAEQLQQQGLVIVRSLVRTPSGADTRFIIVQEIQQTPPQPPPPPMEGPPRWDGTFFAFNNPFVVRVWPTNMSSNYEELVFPGAVLTDDMVPLAITRFHGEVWLDAPPIQIDRITRFKFAALSIDSFTANPIVGSTPDGSGIIDPNVFIKIALPYLLRRTPFHNRVRNGIRYTYSSSSSRVAKRLSDEKTENQIIIQRFVSGDTIFANKNIKNGTGVISEDGTPVVWLAQDDGRAWARRHDDDEAA